MVELDEHDVAWGRSLPELAQLMLLHDFAF